MFAYKTFCWLDPSGSSTFVLYVAIAIYYLDVSLKWPPLALQNDWPLMQWVHVQISCPCRCVATIFSEVSTTHQMFLFLNGRVRQRNVPKKRATDAKFVVQLFKPFAFSTLFSLLSPPPSIIDVCTNCWQSESFLSMNAYDCNRRA